jgi:DNA-binding PadR family transcriptional regulator
MAQAVGAKKPELSEQSKRFIAKAAAIGAATSEEEFRIFFKRTVPPKISPSYPSRALFSRRAEPLEFQVLAVLLEQPRDAYGITIMQRIEERTGRPRRPNAIYAALDRLTDKGLVSSWWSEPTAERGGRRKRLYKIEASGAEAVRRARLAVQPFGGIVPAEA